MLENLLLEYHYSFFGSETSSNAIMYRLDVQVCLKFDVVDFVDFKFEMVDNTKFNSNLKFGVVDHFMDGSATPNSRKT